MLATDLALTYWSSFLAFLASGMEWSNTSVYGHWMNVVRILCENFLSLRWGLSVIDILGGGGSGILTLST